MKLIFLDINGVLNSSQTIKDNYNNNRRPTDNPSLVLINRVNKILDETGAKIVISSSWRIGEKLENLKSLLENCGLNKDSIIDFTPILPYPKCRGDEIFKYLKKCLDKIENFVIIDDDSDMLDLMPHLIQTSFQKGIQEEHVTKAINKLNGEN